MDEGWNKRAFAGRRPDDFARMTLDGMVDVMLDSVVGTLGYADARDIRSSQVGARASRTRDTIAVMSWRSGLIIIALLMWAVTGPIGMAFDGCALTCDEPCALTTASISVALTVPFISTLGGPAPELRHGRPIRIASSLEPPPRALVLSA